ncbi:MAG: hypothetical protein ACQEQ7_05410 [Thermodesulfobacteriota bacterium]
MIWYQAQDLVLARILILQPCFALYGVIYRSGDANPPTSAKLSIRAAMLTPSL